jgi:zeaxanthin glucosyltransferase
MSRVAFLLDLEEGHFLPTFKLAKDLRSRGHQVFYLGPASAESLVCQQGFDFVPILGEALRGAARSADAASFDASTLEVALLRSQELDGVIEQLRLDGMILLSLYYLEALLVHCRYRLPVVLLTTHFRAARRERAIEDRISERLASLEPEALQEVLGFFATSGFRFRSFWDVTQVILRIPELVLLPKPFDLPDLADDPHVIYVGDGVDLTRAEEPFPLDVLDSRLPLVYCSLGSQCDLEAHISRRFFQCVVDTAAARPDLQFLLSVSKGFSPAEFPIHSANLVLSSWIPQVTVLGRADLMVNHAGNGTVKECIVRGVPMVVLPFMRDQFNCAQRVIHHGLGVQGDLAQMTPGRLSALIDSVVSQPDFKLRAATMQRRFREADDSQRGVEVVEAAITGGSGAP